MKTKPNPHSHMRVEVTKDHIARDLRKIGVKEGDHIAVVLSFKSIGYVKGGPEAFIDALLETVGPNGTIMMNTHTQVFPLSKIASNYVFDYKSTPALTGLVPETLRKRRNSIRSKHPYCSVTAIGKLAKYLTEDHNENSSLYMPYSRLAKVDGQYLCIGLGHNLVAIRHEAQHRAGLFNIVQRRLGVKYRDDKGKVKIYVANNPPCNKKLPELVPILGKIGILKIGRIGRAYSILAPAKQLIDAMTELLEENPTSNLCESILCLWCRESERKMNLYNKIKNPKYFQKSVFMINIIALINRFRLEKFNFLSFQDRKENDNRETGRLEFIKDEFESFVRIWYLIFSDFLQKRHH